MGNQVGAVQQYSDNGFVFKISVEKSEPSPWNCKSLDFEYCRTTWNVQKDPFEESDRISSFYLHWAGTSKDILQEQPVWYKMCIKDGSKSLLKSALLSNNFNCDSRNGSALILKKPYNYDTSACSFYIEFFPPEVPVSKLSIEARKCITKIENKQKRKYAESESSVCKKESGLQEARAVVSKKFIKDLKSLWLSEEGSDVTLKVQDEEFKAHRAILRARSSVFSAMFSHEMPENISGVVTINDCEAEIFEVFLAYLYFGGTRSISNDNVAALHKIAHFYNVTDLVSYCISYMANNLSASEFCDFYRVVIVHSDSEMIEICQTFFANNAKDIIATDKWQNFIVENPEMGNECFKKVFLET